MRSSSSRQTRPLGCLFLLLKLLAVYVLSYGPVQAMYSSQRLQGPAPSGLMTFYQPLNWMYDNTPLGRPMHVYDGWWKRMLTR
jgi:hypothetical protein